MTINGKTNSIINRFPHFFNSGNTSNLLHQFLNIFGGTIEQVEADLMRVLRSHYIDTADNVGSQGFDAKQKGDLDKIFALYLEKLGGTSQLMRINQPFQATDIKQVSEFIRQLIQKDEPLASYIWNKFPPPTRELLIRYDVSHSQFKPQDFGNSDTLIVQLIAAKDALTSYLRSKLSDNTKKLLQNYDASPTISTNLTIFLAADFNQILREPLLYKKFDERTIQLKLCQLIKELRTYTGEEKDVSDQRVTLGEFLRKRLSLLAQKLLYPDNESNFNSEKLRITLASELNPLLQNIIFCQQLLIQGEQPHTNLSESRLTSKSLIVLLEATYEELANLLAGPYLGDRPSLNLTTPTLSSATQNRPRGDDLQRLNRMLLDSAYSQAGLPSSNTPALDEVQKAIATALNQYILTDTSFYQQNLHYFTEIILTPEAQNLIVEQQTGENLQHLNRLLLEAAYPSEIEKSYAPYRERLKYLITVLKNGAATKEGIIDIVAANLGINSDRTNTVKPWEEFLFDLPLHLETALNNLIASSELQQAFQGQGIVLSYNAAVAMEEIQRRWVITDANSMQVYNVIKQVDRLSVYRQLIRIIEFLPESQTTHKTIHPRPDKALEAGQNLDTTIEVNNPNLIPTTPSIQIKIRDRRSANERQNTLPHLTNLSVVNQTTGESVQYQGALKCDEVLLFLPNGSVLINGIAVPEGNINKIPSLPIGKSNWYITSQIGRAQATLDRTLFDFSLFDQQRLDPIDFSQATTYALEISVSFYKLTPGSFLVKIPWDIPGYTDKFDETHDHPRHQIKALINKVKAAGVMPVIAYEKQFTETQESIDTLTIRRSPFSETHELEEYDFDISSLQKPYAQPITHEITDKLVTSAVFDYTRFDSLNTFT